MTLFLFIFLITSIKIKYKLFWTRFCQKTYCLDKVTTVKVAFKTKEVFQRWGLVFVESIKSDDELRRLQVLEPLQR